MIESQTIQDPSPLPSDEQLREFINNATVGIHMVDVDGVILYANRAELDMLGYKSDEYVGHHIAEFHSDKVVIENMLNSLLDNKEIINQEAALICKDGSVKDVLISSNARWRDNKYVHSRCLTRDITPQKKIEKLLRLLNQASEELTSTLDTQEALEKMTKYIVPYYADWFVIDLLKDDKTIELIKMVHADPEKIEWAKIYRDKNQIDLSEETVGSVGWVIRHGEAVLIPVITDEMIEKAGKNEEHLTILRKLSLRSAMVAPMSVKGKIIGTVSFLSCTNGKMYDSHDLGFARDFSNRIALTLENARLYEQAQKDILEKIINDKKKDEFISIASHELKTPVTSLKAFTQILQMKFSQQQNPMAADLLSKMDKQIDKLTNLIVDLLDITKINNGEISFNLEEFQFNTLVEDIAEEMQRTSTTHKIRLELKPCEKVRADKARLGQVITNFISNAIKYSPHANEVIVTTSCHNNLVTLNVRDFGIGIPASEKSNVFNRFFRVAGNKNHYTFPGLGLGLYISSDIVKRHGGKIWFESAEEKGSVFSFEIPSAPNI